MKKEDVKFGTVLTVRKDLIDNKMYGENYFLRFHMCPFDGKKVTIEGINKRGFKIKGGKEWRWTWEMMQESQPDMAKQMLEDDDYIVLCTIDKAMSRYDEVRETKLSLKRNLKELKKESMKVKTQIEKEIYDLTTQLSYLNGWIDRIESEEE